MPFTSPNYTKTPNQLFDIHMREMSDQCLRVVLAVVRRTIGFHTQKGTMTRQELIYITGIMPDELDWAIEEAELRGLIKCYGDTWELRREEE